MASLGKPVLVPCGGHIHLAHRTPAGMQLSIENWSDITRAMMAFGSAAVELAPGLILTAAQIAIIKALATDAPLANKRGMKALEKACLIRGQWRKKTERPALSPSGLSSARALFPHMEIAQ